MHFDNVDYANVGAPGSLNSMAVEFFGSLVLPPARNSKTFVTAPFLFAGIVGNGISYSSMQQTNNAWPSMSRDDS